MPNKTFCHLYDDNGNKYIVKDSHARSEIEAIKSMIEDAEGVPGKSAYDIAKEHGFDGTEEEWLSYITANTEQITTIKGDAFRFFVGTQEEYEAIENKENLFAIISDDSSVLQLDAVTNGTTYGLEYLLYDAETTYYIVMSRGSATSNDIVIPSTYNGIAVKGIYSSAFQDDTNITTVKLPSSIEEIGALAFSGCENLRLINIPESVATIGRLAFSGCSDLTIVCERDEPGVNWNSSWNEGTFNTIYGEYGVDVSKSARSIDADWSEEAENLTEGYLTPTASNGKVTLNVSSERAVVISAKGEGSSADMETMIVLDGFSTRSANGYFCKRSSREFTFYKQDGSTYTPGRVMAREL